MSEVSKIKEDPNSVGRIKILMDLPNGIDPAVLDKIGKLMPINMFFDGLLDYVYNNCMRNLLEYIDAAAQEIESPEKRKEYEDELMDLVNENVTDMVAAFRKSLGQLGLYNEAQTGFKWIIETIVYDSTEETLAAVVVSEPDSGEDDIEGAGELIEEEEDDEVEDEGSGDESDEVDEDVDVEEED
jgi:hypothetical protein